MGLSTAAPGQEAEPQHSPQDIRAGEAGGGHGAAPSHPAPRHFRSKEQPRHRPEPSIHPGRGARPPSPTLRSRRRQRSPDTTLLPRAGGVRRTGADTNSVLLCQCLPLLVVTMIMFYTRPCSTLISLPNKDYIGTKSTRGCRGCDAAGGAELRTSGVCSGHYTVLTWFVGCVVVVGYPKDGLSWGPGAATSPSGCVVVSPPCLVPSPTAGLCGVPRGRTLPHPRPAVLNSQEI